MVVAVGLVLPVIAVLLIAAALVAGIVLPLARRGAPAPGCATAERRI